MAYQKYNWKKGDAITAERLNNIEEGISLGGNNNSNITEDELIFTGTIVMNDQEEMSIADLSTNVENYNINNYRIDHIKFILDISLMTDGHTSCAYIPCTAIDGDWPQFSGMIGMGKNFISFGIDGDHVDGIMFEMGNS